MGWMGTDNSNRKRERERLESGEEREGTPLLFSTIKSQISNLKPPREAT